MLTDKEIRAVQPREKPFKLADGSGLHLLVTPSGGKLWRYRYEIAGREKVLALGSYPEISLAAARKEREAARALLRERRDPATEKRLRNLTKLTSNANLFEDIAREWHALKKPQWTARHAWDVLNSLEVYVFPKLGRIPITEITMPVIITVLRDIENRPAIETAHRVRQRMSEIFVFAAADGRATDDPAAKVKPALKKVVRGRQPAIVELDPVREVLRAAEAIPAYPVSRLALRLLALTALRPGELRGARWEEFKDLDSENPIWEIPAPRMKMKREHLVPLSRQAAEVVQVAWRLSGVGPLVFPSVRHVHKPISENAIGYLINRAGYHQRHVPHGWRASFSSIMNERHRADSKIIDLMLAHSPKDQVEAAYNRAEHMDRRRELAQEWADLLLEGMPMAEHIVLGSRR